MIEALAPLDQETIEQELAARKAYLDELGLKMEEQKDKAVVWRSAYEARMNDADIQYMDGVTQLPDSKSGPEVKTAYHQHANDNITRTLTRTITARIQDMLFPTSEKNFAIKKSPEADMPGPEGNSPEEIAAANEDAERRATRMESRIDDYLIECDYSAEGRACIFNAMLYGTGVMKGPFVRRALRKAFTTDESGASIMYVEEKLKPASENIDPRSFYPQPSRNMDECEHVFQLHLMTPKAVRNLARQFQFDKDQINELLKTEPEPGSLADSQLVNRSSRSSKAGSTATEIMKGRYPVWEYHGPVPKECLKYFGVDVAEDDELTTVNGEIWFCQGKILKAIVSHLEGEDRLPYYVFCYEKDPDSIFGYGVPYFIANDQYITNILLQAASLNAMRSAVPITAILKGAMYAQNGNYDIGRVEPWILDGTDDINKALQISTVPFVAGPALDLYARIKENAEEHAMLPMIAAGEPSNAVPTASGLAMLMNASNIVQRQCAKAWDDDITYPKIKAYITWEMLYGTDQSAKGDFDVAPKGASHLLVKDVQTQNAIMLLNMASANPEAAKNTDMRKAVEAVYRYMDMTDVLLPKEQVQEPQPPPPDPRIEVENIRAQIATQQMQADLEREQMRGEVEMLLSEAETTRTQMKLAAETESTQDDLIAQERREALTVRMKEIELAMKDARERQREQLKAQTERLKIGLNAETKARELAAKEKSLNTQVALEKPFRY